MTLAKASGTLGLVTLAVFVSPAVFAQAYVQDSGWYGGANVGQSRATIDNERITSSQIGRAHV